jgi:uncharacterized protein (TIGR03118 family)
MIHVARAVATARHRGLRIGLPALMAGLAVSVVLAMPAAAASGSYKVHALVADRSGHAANKDPNLVNGWGIVAGPSTPWWVSDNGTDKSTLYDGSGNAIPLVVNVGGGPTGTVFNGSSDFVVSHNSDSGPALFLFASEDGKIRGWNPNVPSSSPPSTKAFVVANRSGAGAIYKGLAIASMGGQNFLYATDFHNGRVDVYNGTFVRQHWAGAFMDPNIPSGFAPFGIQAANGMIIVTYAQQDSAAHDEVDGRHLGYVDAYATDGTFIARVASRGSLDAPWGIAWAPDNFSQFSGDLLVGNFGNGRIHAYRLTSGGWVLDGTLRNASGQGIAIDGLWGIAFGNGGAAGPTNTLYFAAGPHHESHGLFGSVTAN